jgi:hypothetical protein
MVEFSGQLSVRRLNHVGPLFLNLSDIPCPFVSGMLANSALQDYKLHQHNHCHFERSEKSAFSLNAKADFSLRSK